MEQSLTIYKASAGSGKTFALTVEYIMGLLQPQGIGDGCTSYPLDSPYGLATCLWHVLLSAFRRNKRGLRTVPISSYSGASGCMLLLFAIFIGIVMGQMDSL